MTQREMFLDAIRNVAKLCAVAAMTAPKSGGQLFLKGGTPFIETVIVDDRPTLNRLADWLRERGNRHREAIWFRDADTAEKLDLLLFIGLAKWYPPQYDCGACGFAHALNLCRPVRRIRAMHQKIGNLLGQFARFEASIWVLQSVLQRKQPALTTWTHDAKPAWPRQPVISKSSSPILAWLFQ